MLNKLEINKQKVVKNFIYNAPDQECVGLVMEAGMSNKQHIFTLCTHMLTSTMILRPEQAALNQYPNAAAFCLHCLTEGSTRVPRKRKADTSDCKLLHRGIKEESQVQVQKLTSTTVLS